jgi:hypothetical protein
MLPLLASDIPFDFVIGSSAEDHGAALAGLAGSVLIFGGSAQLAPSGPSARPARWRQS